MSDLENKLEVETSTPILLDKVLRLDDALNGLIKMQNLVNSKINCIKDFKEHEDKKTELYGLTKSSSDVPRGPDVTEGLSFIIDRLHGCVIEEEKMFKKLEELV